MFQTRIKTSILILTSVCIVLGLSHIPLILHGVIIFLCVSAIWEMSQALMMKTGLLITLLPIAELLILLMLPETVYHIVLALSFAAMIIMFSFQMHHIHSVRVIPSWAKILILMSIPVFFSGIKYIRRLPDGIYILSVALFVCMITDSFAYLVGRQFGRHKLAPNVSPSKTIEGSIGGTAAATLLILFFAFCAQTFWNIKISFLLLTVYLISTSMVAQFGDLCMSVVKRIAGIKDYSNLLPGHGGILDRFDSLLFVLPYTCLFCSIFGEIFILPIL